MSKVEDKIRSGHYRTAGHANMAISRANLSPKEKARLRELLVEVSAGTNPKSDRAIYANTRIIGIEKLAAQVFAAAARANIPIEQVFQQIQEVVKNWGIG